MLSRRKLIDYELVSQPREVNRFKYVKHSLRRLCIKMIEQTIRVTDDGHAR